MIFNNIYPPDVPDSDLDPMWGMSYQVCNTYENNLVGILASSDGGETYSETVLSTQNILNNYRRMPQE